MPAEPANSDLYRSRVSEREARTIGDLPGFQLRIVMQSNREIRLRDLRVKPVSQHRLSPVDCFFCRLTDQNQSAAPLILQLGEHLCRAQHVCDVNVVTTSVHDANVLTSIVLGLDRAR